MDRLRAEFEALGFTDVSTFIASGNVLFEATGSRASLEPKIEARLAEQLGYAVPTFVRTASAVRKASALEPYGDDRRRRHAPRRLPAQGAHRGREASHRGAEQRPGPLRGARHGAALAHPRWPHRFERQDLGAGQGARPTLHRPEHEVPPEAFRHAREGTCQTHVMSNVMEGIRILEVAEHTFVPAASAILSDWGAEVIKIEHVERGDAMRGLMNTGLAGLGGSVHVLHEHANRGKKSLGLDLTNPAGLDILYRLAARCDVFLTNKMPGVRERLHIDVDDIRAHNPNIVYVRGTGYGNEGPDADAGGYDFLGFWARAGCADAATPDRPRRDDRPACARLRRLDRRHDHRGWHCRRAPASRAHRRSARGRRVTARRGDVGDGERDRALPARRDPIGAGPSSVRGGAPSNPADRHVPHGRRPVPRLLDAPGLPLLARVLHAHRARRPHRRPALQHRRGTHGEHGCGSRDRRRRVGRAHASTSGESVSSG